MGTRFLPATKAQPKEMLPIIDTPTIQYVVQEAVDSGIEDILIISGKGKRAIEDHFDRNLELENQLRQKQEEDLLNEIRRISDMANIHFIRQKELNGLGDAIYCARLHTANEPFAVLLGDTIIDSVIPVTQQLVDLYEQYRHSVIGVEVVPREKVSRYGIVGGTKISERIMEVSDLVEKPSVKSSPSNFAIAGRYILTPEIFKAIEQTKRGKGNEIQLTDALLASMGTQPFHALKMVGERYDCGSKLGFIEATLHLALQRQDLASDVQSMINGLAKS